MSASRRKWFALALLCTVQFMVVLDIAVVNVALPSIQADLGFSQENLQWVITAYAIAFGGFLLLGGRAADLLGRRRIFMVGVAAASAVSLGMIVTLFPDGRERATALGVYSFVASAGASIGLLAGGALFPGTRRGGDLPGGAVDPLDDVHRGP